MAHEEYVADARAFGVVFCEEAGSCAGGVEEGGLRGGYGCDGVGAGFLDVGGSGCEDGEAEVLAWGLLAMPYWSIQCWMSIGCFGDVSVAQWLSDVRTQALLHSLLRHDRRPLLVYLLLPHPPRRRRNYIITRFPISLVFPIVVFRVQHSMHLRA